MHVMSIENEAYYVFLKVVYQGIIDTVDTIITDELEIHSGL